MKRAPDPYDLFADRRQPARDKPVERVPGGMVEIEMRVLVTHHAAWRLAPVKGGPPAWLPFKRGERGVGRDENVFTLRRADAAERGWL